MESPSNFKIRLWKAWLNHSLESVASEPPSTVRMLMCAKHIWNLHGSNFMMFLDHSEGKWFAKYPPYWILKSSGYFLTHLLPMTTILFEIFRICSSIFKCDYLKSENFFSIFCSIYRIFFFFFLSGFSFTHTDNSQDIRGRQGTILFHSTTSTPSRTFRHLFATLHVRWLSHIFNSNACIYQTATRWDLPPYRITIWLIDDVIYRISITF